MHPDTIHVPSAYAPLGRRLLVENMDTRKAAGQTADDLAAVFAELPGAGLCFDVAHAKAVDATMAAGLEILERCSTPGTSTSAPSTPLSIMLR